jgi:hypothetical protein
MWIIDCPAPQNPRKLLKNLWKLAATIVLDFSPSSFYTISILNYISLLHSSTQSQLLSQIFLSLYTPSLHNKTSTNLRTRRNSYKTAIEITNQDRRVEIDPANVKKILNGTWNVIAMLHSTTICSKTRRQTN